MLMIDSEDLCSLAVRSLLLYTSTEASRTIRDSCKDAVVVVVVVVVKKPFLMLH